MINFLSLKRLFLADATEPKILSMIKFLNTEGLNTEILKLLYDAKSEVLIVVPFIKTSLHVFTALEKINNKGIEITIICRLNELNSSEKNKFLNLRFN